MSFRLWEDYPNDRYSHLFSYSWSASLAYLFRCLSNGISIYPYDIKNGGIGQLAEWLKQEEITVFHPPNSFFSSFVKTLTDDDFFPSIRRVNFGGQALHKQDLIAFRKHVPSNCIIRTSLASTEAGVLTQMFFENGDEENWHSDILPVGYAIYGKRVLILDEDGAELPVNQIGQIAVQGSNLFEGYWNAPEMTRDTLLDDPKGSGEKIFLTGDYGLMHLNGLVEHKGRKDFITKIRGYRVNQMEVETALTNVPGVAKAAVITAQNNFYSPSLVGYFEADGSGEISLAVIREALSKQLPDYMIPSILMQVAKLPLTASGKLDRNALPSVKGIKPSTVAVYVEPQSDLEKKLVQIWEEVLGLSPIGVYDNFFELGGDSLMAMRLFLRIEKSIGMKLPLSILVDANNIHQQANLLADKNFSPNWSPVIPVSTKGKGAPIFCIEGKGGNPLRFRLFAELVGDKNPVYFLQFRGLDGKQRLYNRIEDIAADFIKEIQKEYPHGPYHFVGSSLGGSVAYEMACQLEKAGQEVGTVAMLDTYGPGYLDNFIRIPWFPKKIYAIFNSIKKHWDIMFHGDKKAKQEYIRYYRDFLPGELSKLIRNTSKPRENLGLDQIPPELQLVEETNLFASRRYSPPDYPGEVILFRAKYQPATAVEDELLGWGKVEIGNLVVHEVDCYHGNILFHPAIEVIYQLLKPCLK